MNEVIYQAIRHWTTSRNAAGPPPLVSFRSSLVCLKKKKKKDEWGSLNMTKTLGDKHVPNVSLAASQRPHDTVAGRNARCVWVCRTWPSEALFSTHLRASPPRLSSTCSLVCFSLQVCRIAFAVCLAHYYFPLHDSIFLHGIGLGLHEGWVNQTAKVNAAYIKHSSLIITMFCWQVWLPQ